MIATGDIFDFVVIGAGSAGCAVAGRLSTSGRYRVLLLEAGGRDRNPWIHIPLGYIKTYTDPRINWMFDSEPERQLNGRSLYQPRGKVLGGTSSINGMVYMRGTPADYDSWRQAGCEGWDWDSVLPFFKKAEDQERGADDYHGVGGPLRVSNGVRSQLGEAMIAAAIEAGIPANDDFNGACQEGVGYYQTTTRNGRRWSAARAYLRLGRSRDRLKIQTRALVTRIFIDGCRAVGVEYRLDGCPKLAYARAEIILCSGVFGSPQLLQLSGIGPAELLRRNGIAVSRDITGVGQNLHDHFNTHLIWRCNRRVTVNDLARSPALKFKAALQYAFNRSGHLAHTANYAGAFVRSDPRLEQPDLQINMSGWSTLQRSRTGVKPHPFPAFTFSVVHLRPHARGSVQIKSPDPLIPPAIRFNFLSSDHDFRALIYGMQLSRRITSQPALMPFIAEEVAPGPGVQGYSALANVLRARGVSNLHAVGTCRMGRDSGAVVDPRLRVHGLVGLRIADASIMPQIPGGNTNAPSIMIGEKCAAMVIEDALAR